jgi:predicted metal-dependent phosphoesterase TrpH
MFESLHNHTTSSDGVLTREQLLRVAEKNGIGIVAFTEHDWLPSQEVLAKTRRYNGPVRWMMGVEISSGMPLELGGGPNSGIHLVTPFVDPTNTLLKKHCSLAMQSRQERVVETVRNLKGLGFRITVEDCKRESAGGSLVRPHIVRAILRHQENLPMIEELRAKMEKASHGDRAIKVKYDQMMSGFKKKGIENLPYNLFLTDGAFIPNILADSDYWKDMDSCVQMIRDAGGVAILAHWHSCMANIDAAMLEGMIKDNRLDGLEVKFTNKGGDLSSVEATLQAIADRTDCIQTISLDAHNEQEVEWFARDLPLAEASMGQTQRIIDRVHPDLKYSNF